MRPQFTGSGRPVTDVRYEAAERRESKLRFGPQRCLRERVNLRDCGARNTEDQPAAPPQGDPGFECGDALSAEALEQRMRQVSGQCV